MPYSRVCHAVIDIAESICNEATGQPIVVPIDERISAVAFAQAEAVASVIGTCAGDGSATLQVTARRRAEAQASAVGVASANIVASSGVCDLCEVGLQSFAVAVESLTANAIAEVNLDVRLLRAACTGVRTSADFHLCHLLAVIQNLE